MNSITDQSNAGGSQSRPHFFRRLFQGSSDAGKLAATRPVGAFLEANRATLALDAGGEAEHAPKILVVDDDPVILKTIGVKLSLAGFAVVTGHDGAEAINTARTEHPDVIVLDVCLPEEISQPWDGLRVMQWLQRLENGETPPIIIITGNATGDIRERALAGGAVAFFEKPIDNDRLVEVIRKAVAKRTATTPAKAGGGDFSI